VRGPGRWVTADGFIPFFSTGVNFDSSSKPACDGTSLAHGGDRLLLRRRRPVRWTTTEGSRRIQGHRCYTFRF
jgi:hypothetical protein